MSSESWKQSLETSLHQSRKFTLKNSLLKDSKKKKEELRKSRMINNVYKSGIHTPAESADDCLADSEEVQ